MTKEVKLIQENIKLFLLYQNLEKMTYLPTIKMQQMIDADQLPTEIESSLYYILKLTTDILKSYMEDKCIPVHEDNSFIPCKQHLGNEFLAHSDFSFGLAELIRLYQILDDEQLDKTDSDWIGALPDHPLSEFRSCTTYNHAVYSSAYWTLVLSNIHPSEKEFFNQHPPENPNEYFTHI